MSNLSLSYDPTQTAPVFPVTVDEPMDGVSYLTASAVPQNLIDKLSTDETFRDVFIGTMIDQNAVSNENVLRTLIQMLQCEPSNESPRARVLCEVLAGLSFAWGEKELAKRALLRLDPTKASRYLQTVYTALVERNMDSDAFRSMILVTLPQAINDWDRAKQQV
jgi:hypothetical protein